MRYADTFQKEINDSGTCRNHRHDRIAITVNGQPLNPEGSKLYANPDVIYFGTHKDGVSEFSLSTGPSSKDPTKNKWSVNSIQVGYEVKPDLASLGLILF